MSDAVDDSRFGESASEWECNYFDKRGANELHERIPGPAPVTMLGDRRLRCDGRLLDETADVFLSVDTLEGSVIEREAVLLFELGLELDASETIEVEIGRGWNFFGGETAYDFPFENFAGGRARKIWFRPNAPMADLLKPGEFTIGALYRGCG